MVGSSGSCGRGLPIVANLLLLLVLEEQLWADLPGSVGCFGFTEGAGPPARTTVGDCGATTALVRAVVGSHLCLLTVISGDGGGLGCYVFPY